MSWSITPRDVRFFAELDQRQAAERRCGNCRHWQRRPAPATNGLCAVHNAIVYPTQLICCQRFEREL